MNWHCLKLALFELALCELALCELVLALVAQSGRLTTMDIGAIIILVALLVVMPVGVLMTMGGLAGVLGTLIGRKSDLDNVDDDGEPNEYLTISNTRHYDE